MDINEKLNKFELFAENIKNTLEQMKMDINDRLNKLESSVESIKTTLDALSKVVEQMKAPWIRQPPAQKPVLQSVKPAEQPKVEIIAEQPKVEVSNSDELNQLINLLNSKEWPHAVDPLLICDVSSEQDKEDRAEGILDLIIDIHLENLRFLDFGCGEGHVVNKSKLQKPRMAVGYDIKKHDKWESWEKSPNIHFTTDWSEVKNFGPFNVVLMYDVIDHMIGTDDEIINKLKEIKNLLAPNGKVYVRIHPWCSRHGTHLYRQLNKAFIHMVFSDKDLQSMGYKQELIRKVVTPLKTYQNLFNSAGFRINSCDSIKEALEPLFINKPIIANKIKEHYKESTNPEWRKGVFPTHPLEIQFIDYILT